MWQLKLRDPSGETRYVDLMGVNGLKGSLSLGRSPNCEIELRDPTVPLVAANLWQISEAEENSSPYWIKVTEEQKCLKISDLPVRESTLPSNVTIRIGETFLTLQAQANEITLPHFPKNAKPWFTQTDEGQKVLWVVKKAATTPLSVYLAGETGTGKEVLAHLLHAWSTRASGPFVPLHCGALPLSLAESELFGHVKGAFTGAMNHRPGAFMQAHNGTLFLDEIGDLPLDIQVKLLRFLEDGEIRAVGSDKPSHANVRIICATHHHLKKLVEEGKFRRDLYYRLASITVDIPPLRARPEDVELLASKFVSELNRTISEKAMLRLQAHSWPGNVRELRHAIERASGLAGPFTSTLNEEAFEFLLTPENITEKPELELGAPVLTLREMERLLLLKALRLAKGNRANAAKIIGVARSTLFEMLKRHRIQGPKTRTEISVVA